MEQIIVSLRAIQAQLGSVFGGMFGGLLGVLIEATAWINDVYRRTRRQIDKLEDRVKVLEDETPSSSTGANSPLTPSEAQALATGNYTNVTNVTTVIRQASSSDVSLVKHHRFTTAATGAVATGVIGTMLFPSPIASVGCPRIQMTLESITAAAAAKPIGLVPTFNSLNQCTGYTLNAPIALASTDSINGAVYIDELTSQN